VTAVPLIPGMALEVGLAIVILVVLLGGLACAGRTSVGSAWSAPSGS